MPMNYASQASAVPGGAISSLTVNKPSGTVEGDVLIAMISVRSSYPTLTPPSGWTLVGSDATANGVTTAVYYRVAGASEPANYTWGWTPSGSTSDYAGLILRYTPASPTTAPGLIDASGVGSLASPAVAPSVTASVDDARLVALFSTGSTVGSTPSGMTHRASIDGGLSGAWAYDQLLTSPGATGTRTWTGSGSGVGWTVALFANQASANRIRMMI